MVRPRVVPAVVHPLGALPQDTQMVGESRGLALSVVRADRVGRVDPDYPAVLRGALHPLKSEG